MEGKRSLCLDEITAMGLRGSWEAQLGLDAVIVNWVSTWNRNSISQLFNRPWKQTVALGSQDEKQPVPPPFNVSPSRPQFIDSSDRVEPRTDLRLPLRRIGSPCKMPQPVMSFMPQGLLD